ncbi:hypothetical protein PTSG_00699 [Salpingoeca rosetta]|uniref:N-acetyltransferase domain-containing protein n=1 Tax=Salpingoeca rosetta (strain ATCC 50818 / BSB-021) TaxID=946362 RepID=F2TX83_SALR5|nr:uncharacterized protein PTSG_00699 [Salpingoeca rosetta]EGD75992.1 hypothetical protein PTSG_00699 [Salpingoeca rosetta]|eukprot:XP_004998167.1 hypothetical protein PTSG_00699 [Salpingoeca rosetta]
MKVEVFQDPLVFIERVERFLLRDELQHSGMLGLLPVLEDLPDHRPSSLLLATVSLGDSDGSVGGIVLVVLQYSAWHGMHVARLSQEPDIYEPAVSALIQEMKEREQHMEAVISDPITARAFADAALEMSDWAERVTHSHTRDVLVLKKLKNNKKLAPGKLITVEANEAESYTEKFYDALNERWGDFAPISTQCREALRDAASHGWLFAHVYRDHMVSFCMIRHVSSSKARVTTCVTPRGYRGRGFGKALLCNAIKHLRKEHGIKEVLLYQDEHDPARELYTSIGFTSEATSHIYEVLLKSGAASSAQDKLTFVGGSKRTSWSAPVPGGEMATMGRIMSKGSFDATALLSKGMRAWTEDPSEGEGNGGDDDDDDDDSIAFSNTGNDQQRTDSEDGGDEQVHVNDVELTTNNADGDGDADGDSDGDGDGGETLTVPAQDDASDEEGEEEEQETDEEEGGDEDEADAPGPDAADDDEEREVDAIPSTDGAAAGDTNNNDNDNNDNNDNSDNSDKNDNDGSNDTTAVPPLTNTPSSPSQTRSSRRSSGSTEPAYVALRDLS